MIRAELLGEQAYSTLTGVQVHVWRRGNTYLARGRFQGPPFTETLGEEALHAVARPRQVGADTKNGNFVRVTPGCRGLVRARKQRCSA
jgi:hypothetical protein